MKQKDLQEVIISHRKYLEGQGGGKRADLREANLRGANLQDADLQDADLRGANLRGANLQYADLQYADLQYADLRGVNLRDADLKYASLHGADLRRTDLQGVDLRCADLRETGVCTFRFNQHAAIFTPCGTVSIGCQRHSLKYWLANAETVGKKFGYSGPEIQMYLTWLQCLVEYVS